MSLKGPSKYQLNQQTSDFNCNSIALEKTSYTVSDIMPRGISVLKLAVGYCYCFSTLEVVCSGSPNMIYSQLISPAKTNAANICSCAGSRACRSKRSSLELEFYGKKCRRKCRFQVSGTGDKIYLCKETYGIYDGYEYIANNL